MALTVEMPGVCSQCVVVSNVLQIGRKPSIQRRLPTGHRIVEGFHILQ